VACRRCPSGAFSSYSARPLSPTSLSSLVRQGSLLLPRPSR
jgi:hypothetical protein